MDQRLLPNNDFPFQAVFLLFFAELYPSHDHSATSLNSLVVSSLVGVIVRTESRKISESDVEKETNRAGYWPEVTVVHHHISHR